VKKSDEFVIHDSFMLNYQFMVARFPEKKVESKYNENF
jgi:hypothetical protein